jgi:hypothetical protein
MLSTQLIEAVKDAYFVAGALDIQLRPPLMTFCAMPELAQRAHSPLHSRHSTRQLSEAHCYRVSMRMLLALSTATFASLARQIWGG